MPTNIALSPMGAANLKSSILAKIGAKKTPFKYPRYQHETNSINSETRRRYAAALLQIETEEEEVIRIPLTNFMVHSISEKLGKIKALAEIGLSFRSEKHITSFNHEVLNKK